jgi:Trypsin
LVSATGGSSRIGAPGRESLLVASRSPPHVGRAGFASGRARGYARTGRATRVRPRAIASRRLSTKPTPPPRARQEKAKDPKGDHQAPARSRPDGGGSHAVSGYFVPNHRDAGVVILDRPVILPEYGTITTAGAITSNKSVELTVSGYGITDGHAASDPTVSFRERLIATSTLITTNDTWTDGFNLKAQNNGGGGGGTCSSDSGGPVFFPSTSNVIVAVTSFGRSSPNDCIGNDYLYRLDRQEVIDWIDEVSGSY